MCLAIYKPANVKIDESALECGFDNNDDGAGFTVRQKTGELVTFKGFFKFKEFIKYWRNHQSLEAMIHFRLATSGKKNQDNCHPFRFGNDKSGIWSMIHNGVLHTRTTPENSDTACFTRDVLHELAVRDMLFHTDVHEQLEEEIGSGNKMVLMPPNQIAPIILNEDRGFWEKDVWWSNHSFEKSYFRYSGSSNVYGSTCYTGTSGGSNGIQNWWDVSPDELEDWTALQPHESDDSVNVGDAERYLQYLERKWAEGLAEAEAHSAR